MLPRSDTDRELTAYEERLRDAGQFVTVQRRSILRYLLRHRTHPTTSQIARAVGRNRSASLATVYNNLAVFAELDLVRAVRSPYSDGDHEVHWDIRTDLHHHLSCRLCGLVTDIDPSAAEVRIHDRKLARRIERAQVWLVGVCTACDTEN